MPTPLLDILPHVMALLNISAFALAVVGYVAVCSKDTAQHKRFMKFAMVAIVAFLISYLAYHSQRGITPFLGQGWMRPFYYTVLGTHVLTALATSILLTVTLWFGQRQQTVRHKKVARWTLLTWGYASLSGLIIYGMIYH